jgi:hypothetical protein
MAPSTLTAMRWEDLSIWTRTSARAGVGARPAIVKTDIVTPANSSLASHPPGNRFMIALRRLPLTGDMMSFSTTPCKGGDDARVPAVAVNLNPPPADRS